MQINYKTSRRDFLKLTGVKLTTLALGLFTINHSTAKANPKQINPDIQANFLEVSKNPDGKLERYLTSDPYLYTLGDLDKDDIEEIVMAYNREDGSSLVKFYPLGEKEPFDIVYDSYDDKGPRRLKFLDALFTSIKQKDKDHITFTENVVGPTALSNEIKEKIKRRSGRSSSHMIYMWKIDVDKNRQTGDSDVLVGADYYLALEGDGDHWGAHVRKSDQEERHLVNDFKVLGNEIKATISIKDIPLKDGSAPKSFNYELCNWVYPPVIFSARDTIPFTTRGLPDLKPGSFEIDPNFEGSEKDLSRIYRLPHLVKGLKIEQIDGKPGAVVETEEESYLFQWNQIQEDFEIELL